VKIESMNFREIENYAKLYMSVFNNTPWNDSWTMPTASLRIENMMRTNTFIGKALYADEKLLGLIWGQKEQFYNGMHFQIQEFCVETNRQSQGIGTVLLNELTNSLKEENITNVFLLTSRGLNTEGFYKNKGFSTSEYMILMSKKQ